MKKKSSWCQVMLGVCCRVFKWHWPIIYHGVATLASMFRLGHTVDCSVSLAWKASITAFHPQPGAREREWGRVRRREGGEKQRERNWERGVRVKPALTLSCLASNPSMFSQQTHSPPCSLRVRTTAGFELHHLRALLIIWQVFSEINWGNAWGQRLCVAKSSINQLKLHFHPSFSTYQTVEGKHGMSPWCIGGVCF